MRVIALIEDPGVIQRILENLGFPTPLATERSPPPELAPGRDLAAHLSPGPGHRLMRLPAPR